MVINYGAELHNWAIEQEGIEHISMSNGITVISFEWDTNNVELAQEAYNNLPETVRESATVVGNIIILS